MYRESTTNKQPTANWYY